MRHYQNTDFGQQETKTSNLQPPKPLGVAAGETSIYPQNMGTKRVRGWRKRPIGMCTYVGCVKKILDIERDRGPKTFRDLPHRSAYWQISHNAEIVQDTMNRSMNSIAVS